MGAYSQIADEDKHRPKSNSSLVVQFCIFRANAATPSEQFLAFNCFCIAAVLLTFNMSERPLDIRDGRQSVHHIEPHKNENCDRPYLGKWIQTVAVDSADDWMVSSVSFQLYSVDDVTVSFILSKMPILSFYCFCSLFTIQFCEMTLLCEDDKTDRFLKVCGGGPRLCLWHLRSMAPTTVFDASNVPVNHALFHDDSVYKH